MQSEMAAFYFAICNFKSIFAYVKQLNDKKYANK